MFSPYDDKTRGRRVQYRSRLRFSYCFGFLTRAGARMPSALSAFTAAARRLRERPECLWHRGVLPFVAPRRFAVTGAGVGVAYACGGWSEPSILVGVQQSTATNGGSSSLSLIKPHSLSFKAAKGAQAEIKREQLRDAVAWCQSTGKGAKAAANEVAEDGEPRWPALTFSMIHYALKNDGQPEKRAQRYLTGLEELQLVRWVNKMGAIGKPIGGLNTLTEKVRSIIKARRIFNAHMQDASDAITPLSAAEVELSVPWAKGLSHTWETDFRARHFMILDKKAPKTSEAKRVGKQREAVVKRHFHGEFGLERELVDAGIMDPATKLIRDPRRVINFDETSQMLDGTASGTRSKCYGAKVQRMLCEPRAPCSMFPC